ncbi:hypothetical protein [Clostridium sp. UBA4548]|uniref:hypothetical protein n=1 Tax=Clostridium sp. UBA4548 TaxID=1946361 RepID=UPI0025B892A2|nr:hypothetical protein [Clostridium sp. UBA4548]
MLSPKEVKRAYQHNDFKTTKDLEKKANADLEAVYYNISHNGAKAWTKVRGKDNKEFYVSWSKTGSIWAQTISSTSSSNDGTKQCVVQIGSYSPSASILGIHTYNLTLPVLVGETVAAFIVARAISGIVAEGIGFVFARFALLLAQAAAEIGLASFSFTVPLAAVSAVASCLVFAVVFIGLAYLWNWLNRKYTIRLQIFNWDDKNSWSADGQYLSNAKFCGEKKDLNFTLPKMIKPDDVVMPPGFNPIHVLDSVCYYAALIWENDQTFAEGCSMAIRMKKNEQEGFMWAFDCPRFTDNKQAADYVITDPKAYRDHCNWSAHPLGFDIATHSGNPVSFALDALSGASDNLYNININIGIPIQQS